MTVWCNGEFVERLSLDPADRGLMLGDGVFETIAVRDGHAVWLEQHLTRLQNSALELGLRNNVQEIRAAIMRLLGKSQRPSEVLRLTLTRGPTARGLAAEGERPNLIISLNPFDATKLPQPMRLATSTIRRNATSPASRLKTLSYIDAIAAAREVAMIADDALMLNADGNVACTTVANIFMLEGKKLITPAADQGILPGVTRGKLIAAEPELGLMVEQRRIRPNELESADAVFLTNSLRLCVPVSSIDGVACGSSSIDFIKEFLVSAQ